MTGIGKISIMTSVTMFGALRPCQKRGASMQLELNKAGSQRAEKGRQEARDVMIPAIAVAPMMAPMVYVMTR